LNESEKSALAYGKRAVTLAQKPVLFGKIETIFTREGNMGCEDWAENFRGETPV